MKKMLKQLVALALTLSVCAAPMSAGALLATDVAAQGVLEKAGEGTIALTVSAARNKQAPDTYDVTYEATMKVSEEFAKVVSYFVNTGEYLDDLRFTCVLSDELTTQINAENTENVTVTFSGAGAANYDPVVSEDAVVTKEDGSREVTYDTNTVKAGDGIEVEYKLKQSVIDDWKRPATRNEPPKLEQIMDDLVQSMTMKGTVNVTAAELEAAKNSNGTLKQTTAGVIISYADGQMIPHYNVTEITAATGETVKATSGSSTPSYNVKVESTDDNAKGDISTDSTRAKAGKTVTIEVEAEEGYRLTGLIVTDKKGNQIEVTRDNDGTYFFEMPKGDVTVVPVFDLSATRPEHSGVADSLKADDHIAFMVGDDQGNFRPNANITRAEVAQIFYALLENKNIPITEDFDDVDDNAWYATAVKTLASLGAVKGTGNGKFDPDRPITRAEFATIASNFAKAARDQFDFVDVDESHWAYPYISASSFYGWVAGVGGNKFEPDRPIVRAEAATIVNNMLGRIGDREMIDAGEGRQFPDVSKSHWGWYEIGEASFDHDHDFNEEYTQEDWVD